jgi:CRISPR-associated endonuclease/helicase Cas3
MYFLPKRINVNKKKMKDWILIAGFLQRADHFASFCEENEEDVRSTNPEISSLDLKTAKERVKAEIQKKVNNTDEHSIWQLNKIDEYKDKNLILIAPTGYGKTEFGFLWGSDKKFIYTLPLRSAVNQIYKRTQELFGKDKTGLLHSDADVFLLGDGGESQESLKTYDLARQLAYPAIISTGDQFFPYALRPPGYEKIYATFSYSCLIIDEVQAYDPRAAAIVVKFIEHVVEMGGKFLLMTATLPEFVKDELQDIVGNESFVKDPLNLYEEKRHDFDKIKKHKIKVELIENSSNEKEIDFSLPDDKIEMIIEWANKKKRVLVIANTVKQAKDIFEQIKNKVDKNHNYSEIRNEIYLLHSQFTLHDREEKEKNLEKEFSNPKPDNEHQGKILVATQVVEASLDIDADVLFTEIAPLDALVQRMGRVLRRYGPTTSKDKVSKIEEPNVYVWVFKNGLQSCRGYVYDNELILLSLKHLKDSNDENMNNNSNSVKEWLKEKKKRAKNTNELVSIVLDEIFGESKKTKKRGKSEKASVNDQIPVQNFEIICSEYQKYELVKRLYKSLSDDCDYFLKFRQTKDILDAGYISDRKEEAQKMFREIYALSAIPNKRKNEFLEEVKNFLRRPDEKRNYTFFKRDVLSEFVVQIPIWRKNETDEPVDEWISIQDIEGCSEDEKKKISRWCQGIYFVEYDYDANIGVLRKDRETDMLIF